MSHTITIVIEEAEVVTVTESEEEATVTESEDSVIETDSEEVIEVTPTPVVEEVEVEVEDTVEVTCPVSQLDFDAFATEHANYFKLEAQLGIGWQTESYEALYDLAIETFKLLDSDRYPCEFLSVNLVNTEYSFLRFNPYAQTIELTSDETDEVGVHEKAFLQFSMGSLKLQIPIKVTIFSCELTKVGFERASVRINYEIGSGPL